MIGAASKGPSYKAVEIENFAQFEEEFGELMDAAELGYAVRQFFLNGGMKVWVVRAAKPLDEERLKQALDALDEVEDFGLFTIPGMKNTQLLPSVIAYARKRRAFTLIDLPEEVRTTQQAALAVQHGNIPWTSDAAFYYPRILIPDAKHPERLRRSTPAGSVAGLIARTDREQGVWKAPAGAEAVLEGVMDVDERLASRDQELLNPHGINAIKPHGENQFFVWGARTLEEHRGYQGIFRYIPVRRLALFIEKSIVQSMKWTASQANDKVLWASIRKSIETFLRALLREGALKGNSAKEAYAVRCDKTTMTPREIASGQIKVLVDFAPVVPAEFITLKFTFKSAQP
jgi:phage tail sheath protein FI